MYVIVWEFRISPQTEAEFVKHYGPDGSWARLFREARGYIRTELMRDVSDPSRFVTFDYWQSEEDFNSFREQNRAEYQRLDKKFEDLTEKEARLGGFWIGEQVQS